MYLSRFPLAIYEGFENTDGSKDANVKDTKGKKKSGNGGTLDLEPIKEMIKPKNSKQYPQMHSVASTTPPEPHNLGSSS